MLFTMVELIYIPASRAGGLPLERGVLRMGTKLLWVKGKGQFPKLRPVGRCIEW